LTATQGTDGLGGGGGGGGFVAGESTNPGTPGGSGVVIIAYPDSNPALATIHASHVVNGGSAGSIVEDTSSRSGYRVYKFTVGSGAISW
jgi:hypothetical protein